jgi:hypothetical protein
MRHGQRIATPSTNVIPTERAARTDEVTVFVAHAKRPPGCASSFTSGPVTVFI